MTRCADAELAEQLLRCSETEIAARSDLTDHVRTCALCGSIIEQRRRLAAHWDNRELTQSELLRLRARLPRPAKEPGRSERSPALVAGLAIALFAAAAVAATYAALVAKPATPVDAPPPVHAATPRSSSTSPAQPVSQPAPASADAVIASVPTLAHSVSTNARSKLPDANSDPRWSTVTEALQRHDRPAAEQALTALTRTGDARSRDAARLTLAELWLQSGRAAQAKPALHELAAHGATPTVRARATTLLEPLGG